MLHDFRNASGLLERFAKTAARWLSVRSIQGLAFMDYSLDSQSLHEFASPLKADSLYWMIPLAGQPARACFSLTMAAVLFRNATALNSSCHGAESASFMKVTSDGCCLQICNQASWAPVGAADKGALLRGDTLATYETPRLIAAKVSRAVSQFIGACVAVFDVDSDDYEGACGTPPFDRLRAVRRAQEAKVSWVQSFPLLHMLKKKPFSCDGSAQEVSFLTDYLTELKTAGARILVGVHERALGGPLDGLVQSTASQLKTRQLDGLALLHASPSKALKMKAFRSAYLANDLCLLASIRISDDDASSASIGRVLRELSAHVDFLVIDTHHGGDAGPCRAAPAASLNRPLSGCLPQVSVRTALSWMHEAGADLSVDVCFSVDMRVFRYHTYGPRVLDGACHTEDHLDYEQVCRQDTWTFKQDDYTMTQVGLAHNTLLSFETPTTLRNKVTSASQSTPSACVAVYNYDYDDFRGNCHDTPYERLRALWTALGMPGIPQEEARPAAAAPPAKRVLMCVVSRNTELSTELPPNHCTHLVLAGASFDFDLDKLVVSESVWRLRRLWPEAELFLGLDDDRLNERLLGVGSEAGLQLSTAAAPLLREHGFRGLALLQLNRTSTQLAGLSAALPVMRQEFGNDLQIIVSLEVTDVEVPARILAARMEEILRYASLVVFQTHYTSHAGYCELALPSTFDAANSVPTVSLTCEQDGWTTLENTSGSSCVSRRRGDVWQAFESEALLGAKLERALERYPAACVALFNVDYDASGQTCSARRQFGRLAAVAEGERRVRLKSFRARGTPILEWSRSAPRLDCLGAERATAGQACAVPTCTAVSPQGSRPATK
ncbi:unnamed protein product [Ixodes hexagonus]